jgi:hypothetical protein
MSQVKITREEFQLVGVTCLWLASKFEDERPPLANELLEVTDNTYQ